LDRGREELALARALLNILTPPRRGQKQNYPFKLTKIDQIKRGEKKMSNGEGVPKHRGTEKTPKGGKRQESQYRVNAAQNGVGEKGPTKGTKYGGKKGTKQTMEQPGLKTSRNWTGGSGKNRPALLKKTYLGVKQGTVK